MELGDTRPDFQFIWLERLVMLFKCDKNSELFICEQEHENGKRRKLMSVFIVLIFRQKEIEEKLSLMQNKPKCKEILDRIKSDRFTSYSLQRQMDDITTLKQDCFDSKIYDDYKTVSLRDRECFSSTWDSMCVFENGKLKKI